MSASPRAAGGCAWGCRDWYDLVWSLFCARAGIRASGVVCQLRTLRSAQDRSTRPIHVSQDVRLHLISHSRVVADTAAHLFKRQGLLATSCRKVPHVGHCLCCGCCCKRYTMVREMWKVQLLRAQVRTFGLQVEPFSAGSDSSIPMSAMP
jgi:hypothetical protein